MKKCSKCNIKFTDDVKFCSECGGKLVIDNKKKNTDIKKTGDILRYIFGSLILLVNVARLEEIKWIAIIGFLFGLSLFPCFYNMLDNKIKYFKSKKVLISIVLPIVFGILWLIIIPGEQLKKITITTDDVIVVNDNYKLEFETNLSTINYEEFKFSSSDENIATINEEGVISGISEGTVEIKISGENGIDASKLIEIKYIPIESISITGNTNVEVGNNEKLNVKITPEKFSEKIVSWESSNPEIVSVNENGEISAISQGQSTITVTSEKGVTGKIVVKAYIKVESLSISNESLRIEKTKTSQLNVGIIPQNADNNTLIWTSSNDKIATVSETGMVTAVAEGTATITVKSGNGVTASCSVEVFEVKPESITLNKTSLSLMTGQTVKVNATISPSNASDKSIRWYSSRSSVAEVDNGVIKAVGRGTATITAYTSNSKSAEIEVTVKEKAPITIKNFRYTKDYVCGVEWNFSIQNNTNKQINYITLKWYNFNSVGDPVYDQIDGKNYTALKYTGPLRPGANSGSKRNTTKFYNCSYGKSTFSEIKIEYADGTTKTILNSEFSTYTGITG